MVRSSLSLLPRGESARRLSHCQHLAVSTPPSLSRAATVAPGEVGEGRGGEEEVSPGSPCAACPSSAVWGQSFFCPAGKGGWGWDTEAGRAGGRKTLPLPRPRAPTKAPLGRRVEGWGLQFWESVSPDPNPSKRAQDVGWSHGSCPESDSGDAEVPVRRRAEPAGVHLVTARQGTWTRVAPLPSGLEPTPRGRAASTGPQRRVLGACSQPFWPRA